MFLYIGKCCKVLANIVTFYIPAIDPPQSSGMSGGESGGVSSSTDDDDDGVHYWVPRVRLLFAAEEPTIFARRVASAHRARFEHHHGALYIAS